MWRAAGNSEYSAIVEANGGIFQKGEKSATGQMPQSLNHRKTGNCPCNFGSPEDIWNFESNRICISE